MSKITKKRDELKKEYNYCLGRIAKIDTLDLDNYSCKEIDNFINKMFEILIRMDEILDELKIYKKINILDGF